MSHVQLTSGLPDQLIRIAGTLLLSLLAMTAWCEDTDIDRARAALDDDDRAAAIQVLADRLETEPGDQEARFLYARVLAWDGQRDASLAQYDELLYASSNNADYLLGKALVLYWDGTPRDALPLLDQARALAPDYEAIWQSETRVLLAIGDADSKARFAALTGQARGRFPDSQWPQWPAPAPTPGVNPTSRPALGYLEAGGGYQDLDNGLPDWKTLYVSGNYRFAERKSVYGQLRQTDRFDETDHELQAGLVWPVLTAATLTMEGTVAPGADVLPRWSLFTEGRLPLPQGYGIGLGWRHKNYEDRHLNTLTLTGEKYFGNYYAAWTSYLSKLEGTDTNFANQLRVDRYYMGENRIGLLFAVGKETESVGQGQFVESDTLSIVLTGLHRFTPQWAVTWDLIYHDQDEAYKRGGFRVGFRREL